MKKILSAIIVSALLALPNLASAASTCNTNLSDYTVKNVNTAVTAAANCNNIAACKTVACDSNTVKCVTAACKTAGCSDKVSAVLANLKSSDLAALKNCNATNIQNSDFYKNLLKNINSGNVSTGWTGTISGDKAATPTKPATTTPAKPTTTTPAKPTTTTPAKPATTTPTTTTQSGSLSAYINEVVRLVNVERAKSGLKAVTADATLAKAADIRAQEIVKSFSHTRPDGRSTFTVLSDVGASYRGAGENIAMGQSTPAEVMNGWMNSAGHRANIMNASFTKLGVGVAKDASGRLYWTQMFTY